MHKKRFEHALASPNPQYRPALASSRYEPAADTQAGQLLAKSRASCWCSAAHLQLLKVPHALWERRDEVPAQHQASDAGKRGQEGRPAAQAATRAGHFHLLHAFCCCLGLVCIMRGLSTPIHAAIGRGQDAERVMWLLEAGGAACFRFSVHAQCMDVAGHLQCDVCAGIP